MNFSLRKECLDSLRVLNNKDHSIVEFLLFLASAWEASGLDPEISYRDLVRALNSELDGVPYGEARKLFSEKYLAEMDDHLKEVLELNRPEIEGLISYLELELNKS